MAKRRRSRSGGRSGYGGGGQGGPQQGCQGGQGGHGGRRRRYRPGGGGRVAAGAGAVDMEGEGMRPPELEPEVSENGEPVPLEPGEGVLELHPNGYGFLRSPDNNYSR